MSAEQRESIEGEIAERWLYEDDLYIRWAKHEIDDDKVIESIPAGANIEDIVRESIYLSPDIIPWLGLSVRDIYILMRVEDLISILINTDLITLERTKEMKKGWDKNIKDFAVEAWPCSTD